MLGEYAVRSTTGPARQIRRLFWYGLGLAFLSAMALPAVAGAKGPQTATPTTVEAQVQKFGVGKDVKVTLTDGQKLRGNIASIGGSSFAIALRKKHTEKRIPYNDVAVIKDPGPLVWILVGAAVAVIIIIAIH
jgi:hypothetical protein